MTRNEDLHTEHVTALALTLFDAIAGSVDLSAADRPLLETAARLHDIGYASAPSDHVRVGANLVLKHGVLGFTEDQVREVAAIMLLHGGPLAKRRQHPVFATLADPARIERLGALLRVADGLDHGHAQNTHIASIRRRAGACEVLLRSPGYAGNRPWAEKKSDLWQAAMPLPLRLSGNGGDARQPFSGIVREDSTRPQAVKRILHSQFRLLADQRDGVLAGRDADHLHRLRIALRRFRVGCRFFAKLLRQTSAAPLQLELAQLTGRLSPARDADVWLESLARYRRLGGYQADADWQAFIDEERRARARHYAAAAKALGGSEWVRLQNQLKYFLRIEISDWVRQARPELFVPWMEESLLKRYRRCRKQERLKRSADRETLHDLRRDLRRERCIAEMAASSSETAAQLARRYKAVAQALGEVHDAELHLDRLRRRRKLPPQGLVELLEQSRDEHWERYRESWRKLKATL